MENVGLTNISNNYHAFQTMAPAHVVSRNSRKSLVLPKFSMLSHRQIIENVGLTNISNNFHDFPSYRSGSRGFSKIMDIVGLVGFPPFSVSHSWKGMVLPTISMIPSVLLLGGAQRNC